MESLINKALKANIFQSFLLIILVLCIGFLKIVFTPINIYLDLLLYLVISTFLIFIGYNYKRKYILNKLKRDTSSQNIINQYFENSIDLLCIADTKGRFQKLNKQWERTLGYKLEELTGKPFIQFVHPEDIDITTNATYELAGEKQISNFINRYRHKNGTYRWIEWRSFPSEGFIYANARDITDRKDAESALAEINSLQSAILKHAGYAIIAIQPNGSISTFNNTAEKMLGYQADEMIGLQSPLVFHLMEEIEKKTLQINQKYDLNINPGIETFVVEARMGINIEEEWTYKSKEGIHVPVLLKISALKDESGNITGYMGIAKDLSQQKIEEEEARQKEILLRDYYQIAKLGAYKLNVQTGNWICTEVLEEIFGMDSTQEKNINVWLNLLHPDDKEKFDEYYNNYVLKQRNQFNKEFRIVRLNDSQERWIHAKGELEYDSEGKPLMMIGTIQDITEKKQDEDALIQSEKKYRLLFENMTSGFALHQMVYDENGKPYDYRYIEANPAFEKLTGLPVNAIIGKTIKELVPNIEDYWIQTFGNVALTGEPLTYMNYVKELGKYYDTYVFSPEKDKYAVVFNDSTERINAENALRESESRLRSFIDESSEGIFITNESGIINEWNKSAENITGLSREKIIGQNFWDAFMLYYSKELVQDKIRQNLQNSILEMLETGKVHIPARSTYPIQSINNKKKFIEQTIFSMKSGNGFRLAGIFNDITERIRTEEALKQERTFSDALLESVPGLVYMYNEEGYLVKWNKKHETDTGYSSFELSKMGILDWYKGSETDLKSIQYGLADVSNKGHGTAEAYLQNKDGSKTLYYFSAVLTNIEGKNYFTGIGIDISERKKMEEQLRKSELSLANAQQIAKIGSFEINLDRGTGNFSDEMYKLMALDPDKGFPSEEEFLEVIHPNDRDLVKNRLYEHRVVEYRSNPEIGPLRYFLSTSNIIKDPVENANKVIGTVQDITERKLAEELIRKSEAKLQKAQTIGGIGYSEQLLSNMDKIWASAEGMRIYGFEPEDGYVTRSQIGACTVDIEAFRKEYFEMVEHGKRFDMEFAINPADGSPKRYIHAISDIEKDENGEPYSILSTFVDISDHKRAEEEIKKLNADLEKRVFERTAQLQQANKDLESFAYSVSHDLRSPLRHIDGFVRLLYATLKEPNDTINSYYNKINQSSKRMSGMIDDLLSFSRLSRKDVSLSIVNINSIIDDVIDQIKPDIGNREIKWKIKNISQIHGDKNLLRIVFENLISNAIKYTSKKEFALIEIGEKKAKEGMIEIYVKDNGTGFDMVYHHKLFGVFQRLHSNEEFEGTGIGLANVKQIIQKHGGTVRAEGKVEQGAIFYINLPK